MTDTSKQGTGEEFGSFELGEYTIRIEDDGCNDRDVKFEITDGNGDLVGFRARTTMFGQLRDAVGDDGLEDLLSGDVETGDGSETTTVYDPPSFKCDDCNRTCPWSWNVTPDAENKDLCKECDGE